MVVQGTSLAGAADFCRRRIACSGDACSAVEARRRGCRTIGGLYAAALLAARRRFSVSRRSAAPRRRRRRLWSATHPESCWHCSPPAADSAEGGALSRDRFVQKFLRGAVGGQRRPENYLALRYGSTVHGFQYRDPQRARLATGYYGPCSGANMVIRNWPQHPMRVGLVGMGVGTLAALAQPGTSTASTKSIPTSTNFRRRAASIPTSRTCAIPPDASRWFWAMRGFRWSRKPAAATSRNLTFWCWTHFRATPSPCICSRAKHFSLYDQASSRPGVGDRRAHQQPDAGSAAGARRSCARFRLSRAACRSALPTGPFSQSDWILLSRDSASLSGKEIAKRLGAVSRGYRSRSLDRRLLRSIQSDALERLGEEVR